MSGFVSVEDLAGARGRALHPTTVREHDGVNGTNGGDNFRLTDGQGTRQCVAPGTVIEG